MAEDPRFLLHFKTLAKFNEKLADGTISSDRHLCFIKDEKLIWCRGIFYSDSEKLDNITDYYNDWSITQNGGTSLTITLTGKHWNPDTRQWETISKPLNIVQATQSVAGLMSSSDKTRLDNIKTDNVNSQTFSANANNVIVTTVKDAGTAGTTTTTANFPQCTTNLAGAVTASDKQKIDGALQRSGGNLTGNVTANEGVTISCSGFYQTSDRDFKRNIKEIDASEADKIELKEFDYTFGGHDYGAIAQEVELIYPSLVSTTDGLNGKKTLNYIGLLTLKIKWLEDKLAETIDRLEKVENRTKNLGYIMK